LHFQSALEVRWCADADISAVLFLRPTAEVPLSATWLKKDEAVLFETLILETDDSDRSTQSWEKVNAALPQILPFLTNAIKVSASLCHRLLGCRKAVPGNLLPFTINHRQGLIVIYS
jgi:hypothetical protein